MYYTYPLWSKSAKEFYTGCTNDLKERLELHNAGKVHSTSLKKPWMLIYYEVCPNKYDAFHREKYLKSGPGKRFVKNRLKYFLREANPIRNSSGTLNPAGIILKSNPVAEQQSIISNGVNK